MVRPVTDDDTGLKVLREPVSSRGGEDGNDIIDIVAVHGLGAHPDDTWTENRGTNDESRLVNWLQEEDMLPSVAPYARIMRYGYKSAWFGPHAIKQSARTVAERLLRAFRRERKSCVDRPLIFIAHSFGGLVVLKVICEAYHDRDEWPGLVDAVRGLIFFGTPFRGADGMSQSEMVQAAAREYAIEDIETEPLHILDPGNELLQDLVDDFQKRVWRTMRQARIACFYELQASEIGAIVGKQRRKAFAVNERSGCLDLSDRISKHSLERTHFNMNKFRRPTEEDYLLVAEIVEDMVKNIDQLPSAPGQPIISQFIETTYEQNIRRKVKYFRGRQEQLDFIKKHFLTHDEAEGPRVLILQAMGGQGKSQIALEYCRQSRSIYPNIFWVNATSEMTAIQSMERVAGEIGQNLTGIDDPRSQIKLVIRTLAQWSERWLIVFDNYDDPNSFSNIEHFIPPSGRGDILLTSRIKGLEGLGLVVTVPPMTDDEGIGLLLHEFSLTEAEAHKEQGGKIVQRLGGLTLTIDQATTFLRYKQFSLDQLDEFLSLYELQRDQILRHTARHFWKYGTVQIDGKEEENRAISAFTTWEMSFQQLEKDEARRCQVEHFLTVSAFFRPDHIGESLFRRHWELTQPAPPWMQIFCHNNVVQGKHPPLSGREGTGNGVLDASHVGGARSAQEMEYTEMSIEHPDSWEPALFWDVICKAHDLSLLDSISGALSTDGPSFSLHPVICDWLQLRNTAKLVQRFAYEAIEMVVDGIRAEKSFQRNSQQGRTILMGHVDMCLENDRRFFPDGQRLGQEMTSCVAAGWFARFYQEHGRYGSAERLYRQSLHMRLTKLGEEDRDTLMNVSNLAVVLQYQGKYEQAEEMNRRALAEREKVLGMDHPDTLMSVSNLALVLQYQGKYKQAEEMNRRALAEGEKVLGVDHPDTLTSVSNLAGVLQYQGKYEQAEEMNRRALAEREKLLGMDHPDMLTSVSNLAVVLQYQGKYEQAEEMNRRALAEREKVLGMDHPDTLRSVSNLAGVLQCQGKYEQAEEMNRRALAEGEKVLGMDHPDTLTSAYCLANLLDAKQDRDGALTLYDRAVAGYTKALGPGHPTTQACQRHRASLLEKMNTL